MGTVIFTLGTMTITVTGGIFVLVILTGIGVIANFIIKNKNINFVNGRLSVTQRVDLSQAVPDIDDVGKHSNRHLVDEQKEVLECDLPDYFKESIRILIGTKFRVPLYQSIAQNHFAGVFSDKDNTVEWFEKQKSIIKRYVNVIIHRCRLELSEQEANYLLSDEFDNYLKRHLTEALNIFKMNTLEAVNKKLMVYEKMEDCETKKELVEKCNKYIKGLK